MYQRNLEPMEIMTIEARESARLQTADSGVSQSEVASLSSRGSSLAWLAEHTGNSDPSTPDAG